ncbi:dedicator of cytokinesis protein 3-like isoform X2 [Rhopilema esculentum]|uniref:dedicator of cytokinesis protein 3-like isoform X2 n=1 Tax=Rhopilema esculentum TaxID=499914 RepID=UPI0031D8B370
MAWKPSSEKAKYGVAIYNFDGEKVKLGISLRVGETVQILEESQDWFRGCLIKNKGKKGIFPKNIICLQDARVENPGYYEVVHPQVEPIVQEVTTVLREWGIIWKKLYLEQNSQMFMALRKVMFDLIDHRRQIMSKTLTQDQQREIKHLITKRIDWGNSKLGLDLVPRVDGDIVDTDTLSMVQLYNVHVDSTENSKSISRTDSGKTAMSSLAKGGHRHLLMEMKSFMVNVGEDSVIFLSLYDSKQSEYISERYMVSLSKHGMPKDLDKLEKMIAVFSDLTSSDLLRELYLVCHVFRQGKLVIDSKKNPLTAFRRPFGVGVIFVADVLREVVVDEEQKEFLMPVYSCSESEFQYLEEYIIKKQTAKFSNSGSNQNEICIGLKLLQGDLDKIIDENPFLKKSKVAVTRRLGFPDIVMPGDIRNDFYVTISHADFERGGKTAQRNVEITMSVVTDKGRIINDCIVLGTGEDPVSEYHSSVFYHNNSPQWNEKVKIEIPLTEFHKAHLRFTYSHCTRHEGRTKGEKFFGFSFIKLVNEDGTVLRDDDYELLIYKMDSHVNFTDVSTYMKLASHQTDLDAQKSAGKVISGPSRSTKESFTIKTNLCSTKLTQNSELVGLLKWRLKPDDVVTALTSVLRVEAKEIVKFLQDVFDALFNILSDRENECAMAVLKVLVHVICFVESEKYRRFKSTIDSYIEEHFSGALAYKSLILCLKEVLQSKADPESKQMLTDTMKSFPTVLIFIIKSKFLHSRSSSSSSLGEFQDMLKDLFSSLYKMMQKTSEPIEAKINALDQFSQVVEELSKVFSSKDVGSVISDFINCVPKVVGSSSTPLRVAKLKCIRKIAGSSLFKDRALRETFLPTLIDHVQYYMNTKQELALCLELLGDVITALQKSDKEMVFSDISLLGKSLLFILLNIYLTIDRTGTLRGLTVACLIGLLKLMEDQHFNELLASYDDKKSLKEFLMKIMVAFQVLLSQDVFPEDWFVLRIVSNNLVLTAIQYLSKAFIDHFLLGTDFEYQLWNNYFQLAVSFIVQPCLQLETFMENKRDRIIDRYGDMRQIMGMELVDMWENLGPQKKNFIPGLIGPFLQVTLTPEEELRKSTIPIFFDMMQVEFAEERSFRKVETELIDKLDILVSGGQGDQAYEELFRKLTLQKLEECHDPGLHENGRRCIESITQLLKRLLDYRAVIASDDCGMDEQMTCTVRLLEFYENLDRMDMYIRYIYKLCDLHIACENYTEAGFVLFMHASLLDWKDKLKEEEHSYPVQPEWERKEQLYLRIIEYFNKGKMWENGLSLCKDLAKIYETRLFDYNKLSKILRTQAEFYDKIMKELRPEPEYFRVAFYGEGFPHYLKNESFIYRGLEYERLASFTQRLKAQFPNATVMSTNKPLDDSYRLSQGQYIQCCNVQPIAGKIRVFEGKQVSEKITSYYNVNEVKEFRNSRPFHKGKKDDENEFKTLWLERTTMKTVNSFPGILRWSRIESCHREELDPLVNAKLSIASKNKELATLVSHYEGSARENIKSMSMVLNGVIDANVNGGISKYQQAFLNEDYLETNVEKEDDVEELKMHLREQVDLLASGLALHERLTDASMRPFHDKMVTMFARMKESIETGVPVEMIPITDNTPGSFNILEKTIPRSPKLAQRGSREIASPFEPEKPPSMRQRISIVGKRITDTFSTSSSPSGDSPFDSNSGNSKSSKTMERRITNSRSTSALSEELSNGGPPVPPRRVSVPSFLTRGSASFSHKAGKGLLKPSTNTLGKSGILAGSAPALDNITEDEQAPPKLPMKRKSTLSSSLAASKYDEAIGANLSQHGTHCQSAFEINKNRDYSEQTFQASLVNADQNGGVGNGLVNERPKSMPPDAFESGRPIPVSRHASTMASKEQQTQKRPIPKPRPRTMILRTESADNLLTSKTMSAENLSKSIPAGERMRSGSEIASAGPPVPLKRAQRYRSQEGICDDVNSKESRF